MQTVEAAHILAVAACLTAPACRESAVLYRELVGGEYHVAVEVGHRHFSRRDKVEIIFVDVVHLALLVGELSRTVARSLVYYKRWLHLEISGLACLVEEELYEGTLQTRSLAEIYGETGAGNLHAEVEVDDVVLLGQIPVGHSVGGEFGDYSTGGLHHIVVGGHTFGHHVAGHVGHCEQYIADTCLGACKLVGDGLLLVLENGNGFLGLLGLILLAGLHELTDRCGEAVELGRLGVVAELRLATHGVELKYFVDGGCAVETLYREAGYNPLGGFLNLLYCKHDVWFLRMRVCECRRGGISGEKFLYLGRDSSAVGTSGESLRGHAHYLAHLLGRCGARLLDYFLELVGEFFVRELLRQIFLYHGSLSQLLLSQLGAALLSIDFGALLALLHHLYEHLCGRLVGQGAVGTLGCLCLKEFLLNTTQSLKARMVARKHRRLYVSIDFLKQVHSEMYIFLTYKFTHISCKYRYKAV